MKPILFNTEMVRAILDGRKTVTRRVVKFKHGQNPNWTGYIPDGSVLYGSNNIPAAKAPYRHGDILYVRETWAYGYVDTTDFECRCNECFFEELKAGTQKDSFLMPRYFYRTEDLDGLNVRWHPSIHMPKEAARLFLRVTDVQAERLQDITEEQARREGVKPVMVTTDVDKPEQEQEWNEWIPALPSFPNIWDNTIKKSDLPLYGWNANPWVWVIEFERCEKPEDEHFRESTKKEE